jgi:hypothetical protein
MYFYDTPGRHHQLNLNSFDFHVDAEGDEYATINHETQKKKKYKVE